MTPVSDGKLVKITMTVELTELFNRSFANLMEDAILDDNGRVVVDHEMIGGLDRGTVVGEWAIVDG